MNKVDLIGNLTKDPELAQTNSGISVCRFTLAVPRHFSNSEGERETDFLSIVVWRGQAENCSKYLKKGSKCAVTGSIQVRTYDATDGTKRYVTEIVADYVEFLSTRNSADGSASDGEGEMTKKDTKDNKDTKVASLKPIDDDTLPF